MGRSSSTIYVGNLPQDIRESEVEDLFCKYGPIVDIDLKTPSRPPCPGYAFVEFKGPRDADDAIRGQDGYKFDRYRLRVELSHAGRRLPSYDHPSSYSSGSSHGGISKRSDYRVLVTELPSSASWQDLKGSQTSSRRYESRMSAILPFPQQKASSVCFNRRSRSNSDRVSSSEQSD